MSYLNEAYSDLIYELKFEVGLVLILWVRKIERLLLKLCNHS